MDTNKMENSSSNQTPLGLEYWLQWQVLASALIFVLPTTIAIIILRKKRDAGGRNCPLNPADLWSPCWTNLHPRWLLFYRAFSFAVMAFFLYQTVAVFGLFVFFFYTQWTFALVMVYFALATIVSIRGCWIESRKFIARSGEKDKFLGKDSEDIMYGTIKASKEKQSISSIKSEIHYNPVGNEHQIGYLETFLQIIYQTCAGAVMLTDIVFWCLLLPFMTGENFQLTLLIGCMHSVNAVFLLLESALNRMTFPWFGLVYFVLWSCCYVVFQWVLHACCFTWWPYPFLELSTPWAPMWYLGLGVVHIPCYALYVLVVKAKHAAFSRMFPHKFVRTSTEKKQV